ncbi:MAG: DUF4345 domain-containing protein [Cyclobacteriaceae bacterium]
MEKSKLVKALLVVSGMIGMGIGGALLFAPVAFEASVGVSLGRDINLLSELRAPGGMIVIAGVLIMLGVFISRMTPISVFLSCLFYLSFGLSRVVGMILDGIPNQSILTSAIIEMVIGLLSLLVLVNHGTMRRIFAPEDNG